MSTIKDFENAPVGATATYLDGSRAVKMGDGEWGWVTPARFYYDDEEMVHWNYTLDPVAPESARGALDLAWELAYEVKPGQIVPKGTRYLEFHDSGLKEYIAHIDFTVSPDSAPVLRTLEPLPEPKPDWIDAPAVMAVAEGFSYRRIWTPLEDGGWASVQDGRAHWSELRDVTPLYPKGQDS